MYFLAITPRASTRTHTTETSYRRAQYSTRSTLYVILWVIHRPIPVLTTDDHIRRVNVSARLPDDIGTAFRADAERLGMSLQMLLTIAVSRWLRQRKEFLALPHDYLVSNDYVVELPRFGSTAITVVSRSHRSGRKKVIESPTILKRKRLARRRAAGDTVRGRPPGK